MGLIIRFLFLLFLAFPVDADCNISWDENDPSENVISYRLYHNVDGSGFAFISSIAAPASSTTCVAEGIIIETGKIGLTAVNVGGESGMAIEEFNPSMPINFNIY